MARRRVARITCKLIALTVHIEQLIHLSGLLLIYAWMHGAVRSRRSVVCMIEEWVVRYLMYTVSHCF